MGRKPAWAIDRERSRRTEGDSVWLFGIHAVRDALLNPAREKRSLVLTRNAADRLAEEITRSGITPRIADPRRFDAPLDPQSVHQGAALEVAPLDWGSVSEVCAPRGGAPRVLLLDRVSDPHNVGAVLRSAEVFGARAVIAPHRHSAPETGALAKTASGALERQPTCACRTSPGRWRRCATWATASSASTARARPCWPTPPPTGRDGRSPSPSAPRALACAS